MSATVRAQFTNNTPFWLIFTNGNAAAVTARIYSSTNIAQPVETWQVLTQFQAGVSNVVPVTASLPLQFFAYSLSNEWGLVFSLVHTTAPPRVDVPLRLVRNP